MADCEVQVDNLEPSAPIVPRDSTASLTVDKKQSSNSIEDGNAAQISKSKRKRNKKK